MKIFHQIVIIIFIGLTLFFLRDDVETVYDRVLSYLKANNVTSSNISDNILSRIVLTEQKVNDIAKSITTPGALVVPDDFIPPSKDVKALSKQGVIEFTNLSRKNNGNLSPLKENFKLNASASKKVQDMFAKQYFEHVSPSGVGVSDLGNEVSYTYLIIGENLALGNFKDDEALVEAWMASPGHRANILNSKYTEIGVAVAKGRYEGHDTWIAVQHFGLPRSICPSLDESLHLMISTNQKQIKTIESDLALRKVRIDSGAVYDGYTQDEQIDQYNNIVKILNKLIEDTRQKIINYNDQVYNLNSCIEAHT